MEKFLVGLLYAAACEGVRQRKQTYYGHHEMMEELRQWVLNDQPWQHWYRRYGRDGWSVLRTRALN